MLLRPTLANKSAGPVRTCERLDPHNQRMHRDVHRMMQRLQQDVITIRRRVGPVPVVLLADGAPELWSLFELHLNEFGCAPVKLVDAWHALEYIAAAARLLESREKAWPGTFRRWKLWLLIEHAQQRTSCPGSDPARLRPRALRRTLRAL